MDTITAPTEDVAVEPPLDIRALDETEAITLSTADGNPTGD